MAAANVLDKAWNNAASNVLAAVGSNHEDLR